MDYHFLCNDFFEQYKKTKDIKKSIKNYINNNLNILKSIYFVPKRIEDSKIECFIEDNEYIKTMLDTISNLENIDLNELFVKIVNELGNILNYKNINKKIYIIIGLNTTTIYSTKYQGEDITVILLESTLGLEKNIKMLLAHEYTHWIRAKEIKHDIFEKCIGERFITEGIACNFSEEMVPKMPESYYCIVPDTTVQWVKDNIIAIDNFTKNELEKNSMMYDFFYMFAKTKLPSMPVRTGYVYGYIKVKEYMKRKRLKVKDIVNLDWRDILNG